MDAEIKKKLLEQLMAKMGGDSLKRIPKLTIAIGMGKGDDEEEDDQPDEAEGELEKGAEVEMEHTEDPEEAATMALDHIKEKPEYYTKLSEAGLADDMDEEEDSDEEIDPRLLEIIKRKLAKR